MWRDIARPAVRYKVAHVIGIVGADRLRMDSRRAVKQVQRVDLLAHPVGMTGYSANYHPDRFSIST
jgi:hypothetical protein